MKGKSTSRALLRLLLVAAAIFPATAQAYRFSFNVGEEEVDAVLNSTFTLGAALRLEDQDDDLVGKSNLNPELCGRPEGRLYYQSCQGLFRTQSFPAERLVSAPGQFTNNADDGNLNYDKYDVTQAPFKLTQDLSLTYKDFGLFARALFFHDFVNYSFREYHPNRVTAENKSRVGYVSTNGTELLPIPGVPTPVGLPVNNVRTDSVPCPPDRNPGGGPCGLVYGPGGVVKNLRKDKETIDQIGQDFQLLDFNIYGTFDMPFLENDIAFKVGRQIVNWGESTVLAFDSLNVVNPPNANNLFRVGSALEEVFTPVNLLHLSGSVTESTSAEFFYQLEWKPLEIPAAGSFYSPVDIGTNNAIDTLGLGFGNGPEDPDRVSFLLDNPLSGLTNTSAAAVRLEDNEPSDTGQYGFRLAHYAEWLNGGTELAFYYMNYHSRTPFISVYSVPEGCGKNATDTVTFLLGCPDVPLLHSLLVPNDPAGAMDDAVFFDEIKLQLEYPEDIKLYGLSFNTNLGEVSLQGELAYRPDAPLQVDVEDLGFAGFGPSASNCHLPETGCIGSTVGYGIMPDGSTGVYGPSDFVVDAAGTPGGFNDTFDLIVGHAPGSGRAFPSFIVPYRGGTLGLNPAESYIRGWEHFDTYQFNLGGTYIMGSSDGIAPWLGADQIITLFEVGATYVPDLPSLDELQLEAPGTFLHASAGADGSGADRSRQACSSNLACTYGVDGLRFNPHQQDLDMFPDKLSMGYAVVAAIRYESILPSISLQPFIIWKHDVKGTAPGLATNFIEGRKLADFLLEIRYRSRLSFNVGYQAHFGGGEANLMKDRDNLRFFVKYQI